MKRILLSMAMLCSLSAYSQEYNYDVNGDGVESIEDVSFLINHLLEKDKKTTYIVNGVEYPMPEAVDLGLPSGTKWANRRIQLGAFGELEYKNKYTDENYTYHWNDRANDSRPNLPIDNDGKLIDDYNFVKHYLGDNWDIPSKSDFHELLTYCIIDIIDGSTIVASSRVSDNFIYLDTYCYYFLSGEVYHDPTYNSWLCDTFVIYPSGMNSTRTWEPYLNLHTIPVCK